MNSVILFLAKNISFLFCFEIKTQKNNLKNYVRVMVEESCQSTELSRLLRVSFC